MYRKITARIKDLVASGDKVVVLLGGRQTGKTTILKNEFPAATYVNLEKSDYIKVFNSRNLRDIESILTQEGKDGLVLILDEVQRLDDPGLVVKLIHDERPNIKLVVSGSSSLEIANRTSESLAGRKVLLELFPLTFGEKMMQTGKIKKVSQKSDLILTDKTDDNFRGEILESMRFGMYPGLLNTLDKEGYLLDLADSTIFKDVFYLNLVKNTRNLHSLLKLLAYQVGQQVNVTELASRIGIARPTVMEYLEILKKIYVVYTLPPFTKKRRDEIGKSEKVFFWDLGLRNAIINDFSPVEFRNDFGNIFENFVVSEFLKINAYFELRQAFYYWRTKWGSEVDLVLQKDEKIVACEIKTRRGIVSSAFVGTYPEAVKQVVTLSNVSSLLM